MRRFFLSRLLREKVLMLAFVAIGAALWLSSVSDRGSLWWRAVRGTTVDLKTQAQWQSQREKIEAEAKVAIEHLDPVRTFNSVRLQQEIESIAKATGLKGNRDTSDARTERSAGFAINSVQFSVRNSSWESLSAFYDAVAKRAPYIGIEQFLLQANTSKPELLDATLRVTSVEILPNK